jgi:hypothetical protein
MKMLNALILVLAFASLTIAVIHQPLPVYGAHDNVFHDPGPADVLYNLIRHQPTVQNTVPEAIRALQSADCSDSSVYWPFYYVTEDGPDYLIRKANGYIINIIPRIYENSISSQIHRLHQKAPFNKIFLKRNYQTFFF